MEDREIVQLLFARNERALQEISARYGREMKRVAMNICQNREDAEEVCNDALLGLWNAIPPENPRYFAAFLLRIVRNHAVMAVRKATAAKRGDAISLEEIAEELGDAFAVADDAGSDSRQIIAVITRFLERSDPTDCAIFMRRYFYADSLTAAADLAGITAGAAAVRLTRMRKVLSEMLKKEGISL